MCVKNKGENCIPHSISPRLRCVFEPHEVLEHRAIPTTFRETMQASQNEKSTASSEKAPKAKQTIALQIEALEAKTRKLKEQLKEETRREREKNTKAVSEFLKAEKLEDFGIEAWKANITGIRTLLEKAKPKVKGE